MSTDLVPIVDAEFAEVPAVVQPRGQTLPDLPQADSDVHLVGM